MRQISRDVKYLRLKLNLKVSGRSGSESSEICFRSHNKPYLICQAQAYLVHVIVSCPYMFIVIYILRMFGICSPMKCAWTCKCLCHQSLTLLPCGQLLYLLSIFARLSLILDWLNKPHSPNQEDFHYADFNHVCLERRTEGLQC